MKKLMLTCFGLAVPSLIPAQPTFGVAGQFYFSTPGGDDSRITEDLVKSSNWTGEYDIVVKNVSGHVITFDLTVSMIGYGRSTQFGQDVAPIPGTDTIRERFAFSGIRTFANNPNITWAPSLSSTWSKGTQMYGGYAEPLTGQYGHGDFAMLSVVPRTQWPLLSARLSFYSASPCATTGSLLSKA